jgi:hypothetical protein
MHAAAFAHPLATPQQVELRQPCRADAACSSTCCINVLASNCPGVLHARSCCQWACQAKVARVIADPAAALLLLAGQAGVSPTSSSDARAAMLRLIGFRVNARLETMRHGAAPCSTGLLPVLRVLLSERC